MGEMAIFYCLAGLMTFSSFMVVTRKEPVPAAAFLIMTMFLAAALYALLGADFVAGIQVLVYAGAIMVLFLFVIMLLNVEAKELGNMKASGGELAVLLLTALGFLFIVFYLVAHGAADTETGAFTLDAIAEQGGNTAVIAQVLFTKYLWPFELASVLILLAIVSAVVIAKKDHDHKTEF